MCLFNLIKFGLAVICLVTLSFLSANESSNRLQVLQGNDIHSRVKDITALSLIIYREYPYLYEGTEEEYLPAIQHYAQSENGLACVL